MFTVRSLKTMAKESTDPISLFISDTGMPKKFIREICFYRLIGMNCEDDEYINTVHKIDEKFAKQIPNVLYMRLQQLKALSPQVDIMKYTQIYDAWHSVKDREPEAQFACPFPVSFQNETLEWTLKKAYSSTMDVYGSETPNVTETLLRSFGVKLLYWIDMYVPKQNQAYSKDMEVFPKLLYVGNIKKQESLFLYFLAMLGWDVLYMNPEGDISNPYKTVVQFSKLHHWGTTRHCSIPIPDFATATPASTVEPAAAPAPTQTIPEAASELVGTTVPASASGSVTRINIERPAKSRQTNAPAQAAPTQTAPAPTAPINIERPAKSKQTNAPASDRIMSYEELAAFSSSVVMIKVFDANGECHKAGSGVVINQEGYILTNFHVVSGASYFSVQFENETQDYVTDRLIKYHPNYDLALIRVDKPCKYINILRQGTLVRGQSIVAIGSPLGLFNSVSDGIISGFRQIESKSMVQFTAPISHGSSGGALLDMWGRLVGIITAGFDQGQNLNLAVDNATIMLFIQNFID